MILNVSLKSMKRPIGVSSVSFDGLNYMLGRILGDTTL
jgi:hypothetical protein